MAETKNEIKPTNVDIVSDLKQNILELKDWVRILKNKICKPRIVENKELLVYYILVGQGTMYDCFKQLDWVHLKLWTYFAWLKQFTKCMKQSIKYLLSIIMQI